MHSHDVVGKTTINMKHGLFEPGGYKGDSVQHVAFNSNTLFKVLDGAPKEFLKPYFRPSSAPRHRTLRRTW
jgi:hypothetical protein